MSKDDEQDEGEDDEGGGSGISLQDVTAIVMRHLRMIITLPIVAGLLAAGVAVMLPNRFQASATVQIDPRNKKILDIEGVLSDLKTDSPTIESEIEIIQSRNIALKVIDQLKLRDDPEYTAVPLWKAWLARHGIIKLPAARVAAAPDAPDEGTGEERQSSWSKALGQPLGLSDPSRDEVAIAFASQLKVLRIRNSLLLEIRFTSGQSVKSARIANAIADAYVRSQIEAKSRATVVASDLLEERLKALREKVADYERRIEQFKTSNDMFDADGQPLDGKQLQREMEALISARTTTTERRSKYEQARRMMLDGESYDTLADVLQNSSIRMLREEYIKAMRREAELATKYGPRHPEMEKVVADVAKAQSELTSEINKIIRSLKSEYEIALDRERQQDARIDRLKTRISSLKDKQWQLKELEREAGATKQLYETILARNKQTEETASLQLPDARIVATADVPLAPSSPKRKLIVIGAVAVGLALGIGAAFLIEMIGAGLGRPEDAERTLKVPHLASIPLIAHGRAGDDKLQLMRAMIAAPGSQFAEAIRGLRHETDSRRTLDAPRVIMMTSSGPGEGKTVISANLALYYAMTRQRTLLIDGDMRRRTLSQKFSVSRQPGLLDALEGRTAAEAAILKDNTTGMHLLPAGGGGGNRRSASPSEALSQHRLDGILNRIAVGYDVIIIDCPPLLSAIDARIIADSADQIVLVASWRRTPINVIRRALKQLDNNRRKLIGVVINEVDAKVHSEQVGNYGYRPSAKVTKLPNRRAA